MNILALQGSPRAKGNTQALLDLVLDGAKKAGAEVECVSIVKLKNLSGCLECHACQQETDQPGCVIHDAVHKIIDKALKADVIVLATPVFCWSPAWPLKIVMDRFYCTFKFCEDHVHSLLKGRKMAAVITAGGGEEDGADLVSETLKRMAKFSETKWAGTLFVGNTESPKALLANKTLVKKAKEFGKKLASAR